MGNKRAASRGARCLKSGKMTACGHQIRKAALISDSVAKTTCKRCLKAVGAERRQPAAAPAVDWGR